MLYTPLSPALAGLRPVALLAVCHLWRLVLPLTATTLVQETFDWIRQWYALAFVDYLDPMKPNLRELLGVRLVIWRDAKGLWRCFEDRCPHRLAPLSEGRIEPSDGTLMCSYHGWRFQGDGQCTDIPQALDSKAKAAAIANPRACAISRPAKVMQGMLFVWGRGGPEAAAEAEAALVPVIPDMEVTEGTPQRLASGHTAVANFAAYYRELPYGWDILAENLQDPSHLPFAHHGVINRRDDDKAGYFEMNISTLDGETGPDVICAEAETVRPLVGDLQKRRFQFRPPGQIRWHTFFRKQPPSGEPWLNLLSFHIVPAGPGRSAVLFSGFFSEAGFRGLPTRLQLRLKLRPKWWSHTFTHNIFDGDSKILYVQERILAESRGADESFSWKKQFFMPAQADRLVMAFRKWLDGRGGGGPQPRLIRPLPPLDDRDGRLLDRYYLHTRHCPYCQGAVRGFTAMQIVAAAVGTMCLLGLSASLGRGLSLFSMYPISMLTGAIASLAAFITAKEVLKRFHYVGYDHSER